MAPRCLDNEPNRSDVPESKRSADGNTDFLILMVVKRLTLVTESYLDHPALDVAVSHSTLSAVARGEIPGVFRLNVPGPVVAFGRADRVQPGYAQAVRAAAAHGFAAVERLAGGRAAVFHESTLSFSWAVPEDEPRAGITGRFRLIAETMASAFDSLGIDARIGQLPGEYCPGAWSVNVAGKVKVMGVGQRLVRGAAHVGGVVVVDDGERIRDVLIPVYRALGLDWDPRTSGALADRSPGLDNAKVIAAIVTALRERFDLVRGELPDTVLVEARSLLADHLPRVA
jgi:octanoyl-[GcvH]:protein N-octanoyltransferase